MRWRVSQKRPTLEVGAEHHDRERGPAVGHLEQRRQAVARLLMNPVLPPSTSMSPARRI